MCLFLFDAFQRETDAFAFLVNADNHDIKCIADRQYVKRMTHAAAAHLGDVKESCLLEPDVNECPKVCDVADSSRQNGADGEIGELHDVLPHERRGEFLTRITAGTSDCPQDIRYGWDACAQFFGQAGRLRPCCFERESWELCPVAQIILCSAELREDGTREFVRLGVDGSAVERRFSSVDAQEACTLSEGCIAETGYFMECLSIGKSAVFITVGDNVLCNRGIDACNPPQQCGRSGVQVNTDMVYGIFYGGIQTFFQFFLADVMLILSDADCLWIDFDELRERDPARGGQWRLRRGL